MPGCCLFGVHFGKYNAAWLLSGFLIIQSINGSSQSTSPTTSPCPGPAGHSANNAGCALWPEENQYLASQVCNTSRKTGSFQAAARSRCRYCVGTDTKRHQDCGFSLADEVSYAGVFVYRTSDSDAVYMI
ncbi:hypothetical protein LI328DRAFT_5058 [Trichoderma asperelloides]|nr:hypothetical protein LI328DRAFT_5058 [Trichoderma asperelloides]